MSLRTLILSNGTGITVGPNWCCTTLHGVSVPAHVNEASAHQAKRLGYGDDVAAMTRHHDPLHSRLCDWIGLPASYSLTAAAGMPLTDRERTIAEMEEEAVMALQRFILASRPQFLEI